MSTAPINTAPRDGTQIIATDTNGIEWTTCHAAGAWRIVTGLPRWLAWLEPRMMETLVSWRPA